MIITINGTPGSGKSTLAKLLAERLGYKHYSIGDLRRAFANEKGISLAELNRRSETGDEDTDTEFDEYQKSLRAEKDFVIDSRLGFHFLPMSLKLFIDADEIVRAERIVGRPQSEESAADVDEAMRMNRQRSASDTARYEQLYGVDPWDTSHYDLVLDSTHKDPETLVAEVLKRVRRA